MKKLNPNRIENKLYYNKEILKAMGLDYYDPFLICRQTHGVLHGDFLWLRWEDQKDFTWEDVKEILGISR